MPNPYDKYALSAPATENSVSLVSEHLNPQRAVMEYLQQLAIEWYEYRGYFVHRDLWVGLESDGSYECELDLVAFHPLRHHLVHIEPSLDLLNWPQKEQHFQLKFDAGRKYLHRMFGSESHVRLEQVALIVTDDDVPAAVAGGKVVRLSDLLAEILTALCSFDITEALVPEQCPLLRTLQYVTAYRERLAPVFMGSRERAESSDSRIESTAPPSRDRTRVTQRSLRR